MRRITKKVRINDLCFTEVMVTDMLRGVKIPTQPQVIEMLSYSIILVCYETG